MHPVTGDQIVTPWPLEAADMGYGPARSLGWAATVAPLVARAGRRTMGFALRTLRAPPMTDEPQTPDTARVDDAMASVREAVEQQLGVERPEHLDIDPAGARALLRRSAGRASTTRARPSC